MAGFALTAAALLCLAGNSILGRLALGADLIDGASYASIRTASGALILIAICLLRRSAIRPGRADLPAAGMLFAYMVCFSFAYHSLAEGTGALILFGAVQITMIGWAIRRGESLSPLSWIGLCIAMLGLFWLVLPGLSAPDPKGAAMRNLSRAQAASLQLTVPVIAAILGIVLLSEALNFRLVSAALAILGGVAVVMTQRQHKTR